MNNDLISREALKKDIEENSIVLNGVQVIEVDCAKVLIDNAPTVDAIVNTIEVRPQGKWIDHTATQNLLWGQLECPFCHKRSNRGASYCQYCGARLEVAEEDA